MGEPALSTPGKISDVLISNRNGQYQTVFGTKAIQVSWAQTCYVSQSFLQDESSAK